LKIEDKKAADADRKTRHSKLTPSFFLETLFVMQVLLRLKWAILIILSSTLIVLGIYPPHLSKKGEILTLQLENWSKQLEFLRTQDFDILGVSLDDQMVDLFIENSHKTETERLERADFTIVSRKELATNIAPDPNYKTNQEIQTYLKQIHQLYPQITALHSLGKSVEGRPIWAIKISDLASLEEPHEAAILFDGLHHAREVMTIEVAVDIIETLVSGYRKDPQITRWVDDYAIWVVPITNPDGLHRVWNQNNMWRKNVRDGHGVDLNRNYPYDWNSCNGSSGFRYSPTYRGPAPASEPETQAMIEFTKKIRPVFNLSFHAYGEMVLYPFGCKGKFTPDRQLVEALGKKLADAMPQTGGRGFYHYGTPWELLYGVDGDSLSWMYDQYHVISYTFEVGERSLGFQPDYARYRDPTIESVRPGWMKLIDQLNGPGISGKIILTPKQGHDKNTDQEKLALEIYSQDPQAEQKIIRYPLKKSGFFHLPLRPGKYHLKIEGVSLIKPLEIQIEDQLLQLGPITFETTHN
jgi:carboxypeptidase T